jgi:cardiolipin synthase
VEYVELYWPIATTVAAFAIPIIVSLHVIFFKRDSRAAMTWITILWFVPFFGAALYYVFGINRIERRARRLRRKSRRPAPLVGASGELPETRSPSLPVEAMHLAPLVRLSETVTGQPLSQGNRLEPLWDGDEAYPAMLSAIDEAKSSVSLCMYIFNNDITGNQFADALGRAVKRGVEVRVLIDAVGARKFSWVSIGSALERAGVRAAWFLPTFWPRSLAYANLRNHRKIMVVDGRIAFTGGMNITDDYCGSLHKKHAMHDAQFRVEGPIAARVQEVFVEDWKFTTGEKLHGERWFPKLEPRGPVLARGVSSGPDEDREKLRLVLLGALSSARSRVVIATPYFLPDADLVAALNIAALRGVKVDILLPEQSDLRLVLWATMAQLPLVLEYGCRVWSVPGPFIHTKLMLVDSIWTMLGSANWDARSLRLNFEFNIECYDSALTTKLEASLDENLKRAESITLTKLANRRFLIKLRDGLARLLTPYL